MSERRVVRVVSYAGYRGDERPMAFHDGSRRLRITDVQRQWIENDLLAGAASRYGYEIRADDGNVYLLMYDSKKNQWCLET